MSKEEHARFQNDIIHSLKAAISCGNQAMA